MSVDSAHFEKAARRVIKQGLRDLLPPTSSPERRWYLDNAVEDLAASLAVVAEVRIRDLRDELLDAQRDLEDAA